jgi:hypothetical protein
MKACRNSRARASWWRIRLAAVVVLAALAAHAADDEFVSESGRYRLSFSSDLDPIEINRMHGWVLRLRDGDGQPVDDVDLQVDGGMPDHDHGLPTRPQVTAALGNGEFRVDGVRFHMHGRWQLVVTISAAEHTDRVVLVLDL